MKFIQPITFVASTMAAVASADPISVLGAGVFSVSGGASCSGSNANVVGACPGPQPGLLFGSCCVSIPNRATVVMGCAPLQSAGDSCANVAARLSGQSTTPPTSNDVTTTKAPVDASAVVAPTTTPSVTSVIPLTNSPSVAPGGPVLSDEPTTQPPTPTPTNIASDDLLATTTFSPTTLAPPKVVMSDSVGNTPKAALEDTTFSNANSILVGATIIGVAVAIIGGVFFVRKNNAGRTSSEDMALNTPPQPASMGAGVYADETPHDEGDFLTPKEDLVCL